MPDEPKPAPILEADELQPGPRDVANMLGGGIDAAGLPPPAADPPGRSSDHAAEGWRDTPLEKP